MDGHDYRALVDRCLRLESSQCDLRYQLSELTLGSGPPACFPGVWKKGGGPYRRVLELMDSAVFVSSSPSLQIVYWNPAAEALFGWKEYEVLGESDGLLVAGEHYHHLQLVVDKLKTGQSWSGQFPLKKKTGEIIIVLMTKSPLYENGELSGFITVSNDAAMLDLVGPKIVKPEGDQSNGLPRPLKIKFRQISGYSKPLIPPVPIPSSVSKLASKVLPRKFGDTHECDKCSSCSNSDASENAGKTGLAAKFLEKLHIKGDRYQEKDGESFYASVSSSGENHKRIGSSSSYPAMASAPTMSNGCHECEHSQLRSPETKEATKLPHLHAAECIKEGVQQRKKGNGMQSSGESSGGHDGSSSKGYNDLSAIMDCEIRWEDLQLGEEIGQGSFAKVYHGMWKGSDVAVKIFVGSEYSETSLLNYKKEIDIMKRLRHPNVLLFMGAAYSHERVAIVTEFLPRGSLFKTIHKDSIVLDIRRRLRMALDVARGMNYLHHRNPTIVHRDLKSSNLLVDRNWSVKVADFGLSRLQNATLLTTKSGRGTPQWMAPEVLKNEPSNEKCDVFSFGVILWELMTRSIPWNNLNPLQVVGVVGFMDRRLDIPEDIDAQISTLICDCWNRDPDRRPSFEEILKRMIGLIRGTSSPTTSTRGGD